MFDFEVVFEGGGKGGRLLIGRGKKGGVIRRLNNAIAAGNWDTYWVFFREMDPFMRLDLEVRGDILI